MNPDQVFQYMKECVELIHGHPHEEELHQLLLQQVADDIIGTPSIQE